MGGEGLRSWGRVEEQGGFLCGPVQLELECSVRGCRDASECDEVLLLYDISPPLSLSLSDISDQPGRAPPPPHIHTQPPPHIWRVEWVGGLSESEAETVFMLCKGWQASVGGGGELMTRGTSLTVIG